MGQRRKWWIGLVPLLALWLAVNKFAIGDVEADLVRRSGAALARATGDPGVSAAASGRDVRIDGWISDGSARQAALAAVAALPGVRSVTGGRSAPSPATNPAAPQTSAPEAKAGETEAPAVQTPQAAARRSDTDSDPRVCRDELAALMQASPIHFEYNRAEIDPESYAALDAAAAILRRCPSVKFTVAGHWRNDRLALGRAENAIARLVVAGIDRGRLTALAAGESRPGAPEEERATDHHLEFKLR